MLVDGGAPERIDGAVTISCRLHSVPLLPRVYQLYCSVRSEQAFGDVFDWQPVGNFRMEGSVQGAGPAAQAHLSTDGPVHVQHEWEVRP
jgi:hypothetical protein